MSDGIDRQRHRCQHEENGRNRSRFGERRGRAARAERRLAALSTESRRDVPGLTALQEDNNNQKQTYDHVNDGDENDHWNREILKC